MANSAITPGSEPVLNITGPSGAPSGRQLKACKLTSTGGAASRIAQQPLGPDKNEQHCRRLGLLLESITFLGVCNAASLHHRLRRERRLILSSETRIPPFKGRNVTMAGVSIQDAILKGFTINGVLVEDLFRAYNEREARKL
ncbi:MAG: hypothetical protein EOP82_02600 [Variovorax sp.]|nr:MAG: hypothetical protein EOP82_02600 [Variovorax sp.]